jgi:hypothetical protein
MAKIDMTNVAYTKAYRERYKQCEFLFAPECKKESKTISLDYGYAIKRAEFQGKIAYVYPNDFYYEEWRGKSIELDMSGYEDTVVDVSGAEVYRYRNLDDDGASQFPYLIRHSNGRLYLIFRAELYGYCVFDFADKKEFCHVPKAQESFIWTDVHYNPANDTLAVGGCFWACPSGLQLLDFHNPLQETAWIDVAEAFGYDVCGDVYFARWEGAALIVNVDWRSDGKFAGRPKETRIEEAEYAKWFENAADSAVQV